VFHLDWRKSRRSYKNLGEDLETFLFENLELKESIFDFTVKRIETIIIIFSIQLEFCKFVQIYNFIEYNFVYNLILMIIMKILNESELFNDVSKIFISIENDP
jgi:hypothetical protein